MINILSYGEGASLKGQEINKWIFYNIHNVTSQSKIAERLRKRYTFHPLREYEIHRRDNKSFQERIPYFTKKKNKEG